MTIAAAQPKNRKTRVRLKRSPKPNKNRHPTAKTRRKWGRRSSPCLELELAQIIPKVRAKLAIFQCDLHGRFQEAQLIAGIVGFSLIHERAQSVLLNQQSQSVGKLNFAAASGLSSLQAVEYFRRQNVAARNRQVRWSLPPFRLFHQIAYPKQSR